jgi:hypothetical protein
MITQIVLFKLHDDNKEALERIRSILMSMEGKIEGLNHVEVQTDILKAPICYDIALLEKFESLDALEAYKTHPVHVEVTRELESFNLSAAAIGF